MPDDEWVGCPARSAADGDVVTLAYGEGGRSSRRFVRERVLTRLGNDLLNPLGDAASLTVPSGRVAFTADGYVVSPLFFPGGDIGRLAVFGTVNDLAVSGARPLWLSLSLVVEEGLPWGMLDAALDSVRDAAAEAGVAVVTGDTKVVPRGAADGLFLNTAGIGERWEVTPPGPAALAEGDVLIVSGPVGRHGIAVLAAREGLDLDPPPASDCGSVSPPLQSLAAGGRVPRAIRDATRGGVAAVLHEWAAQSGLACVVDESAVPVTDDVRAVCELLGLDPLHVACEGAFVAAVPASEAEAALADLRRFPVSGSAAVVGRVAKRRVSPVTVVRAAGREVPLDEPAGAPLPRIC